MRKAAHRAIEKALGAFVPADAATPYRPVDAPVADPEEYFRLDEPPEELMIEKVRRIRLGGPDFLRKRFAFPSQVRTGVAANDMVRGYWFSPVETGVQGALIFLHGWKAAGLRRLQRVARHALALGVEVYLPAHPYHVWRRPKLTYSGITMLTPDLDRSLRSMQQAVLDARSLAAWVQQRGQGPLLLAGVDLGGLVAGLTATVHPGLDGLAVIASHDRVSELLWKGKADRGRFKLAMQCAGVDKDDLDEAWAVLDPGWREPLVDRDKILLVEGRYDDHTDRACCERLSSRWGGVKVSRHGFAHANFQYFARPIIREALALIDIKPS